MTQILLLGMVTFDLDLWHSVNMLSYKAQQEFLSQSPLDLLGPGWVGVIQISPDSPPQASNLPKLPNPTLGIDFGQWSCPLRPPVLMNYNLPPILPPIPPPSVHSDIKHTAHSPSLLHFLSLFIGNKSPSKLFHWVQYRHRMSKQEVLITQNVRPFRR